MNPQIKNSMAMFLVKQAANERHAEFISRLNPGTSPDIGLWDRIKNLFGTPLPEGSGPLRNYPAADEILPSSGKALDIIKQMLPFGAGNDAAGRAEAMARSIGKDPGFAVENPLTTSLGLGALAMLAGGRLGKKYLTKSLKLGPKNIQKVPANTGVAGSKEKILQDSLLKRLKGIHLEDSGRYPIQNASIGRLLGLGLGLGGAGALRENSIDNIKRDFDNAEGVAPFARDNGKWSLFQGSNARGRAEALKAMMGQPFSNKPSDMGYTADLSSAVLPILLAGKARYGAGPWTENLARGFSKALSAAGAGAGSYSDNKDAERTLRMLGM